MKLSTRTRYAMRLLIDLALHYSEQPVPIKAIARRQEVSLCYLQHLINPLVAGGILLTARGSGGGVSLAHPPEEIRLSEVVGLIEGPIAPVDCVTNPDICPRSSSCVTRGVWCDMKKAIDGVLEFTTLRDLVERQKGKEQPKQACIPGRLPTPRSN
jgi:Rrf2 family cysteine metabolism transcriptional repressor